MVAGPVELREVAREELPFARSGADEGSEPFARQPRGACPLCRGELALLDQEPWSMCPSCRLRVVPRSALPLIAKDPALAAKTPLGIPNDDISNDSPHSRVLRVAFIAFLALCAGLFFTSAFASVEQCEQVRGDPTMSVSRIGQICDRFLWHNVAGGMCLFTAVGIGLTLRRGRHEHTGHVANLP